MPAKELTHDQKEDAKRLRLAFGRWQAARRDRGESASQEAAAELLGFNGQSVVSQYLTGKIPLNADALLRFCRLCGADPSEISPQIVAEQKAALDAWASRPESKPDQFSRRFTVAALDLAEEFDSVSDEAVKRALYARLLRMIQLAKTPEPIASEPAHASRPKLARSQSPRKSPGKHPAQP